MLDEVKFEEALGLACNLLQVESFYKDQQEALKQFFRGMNVFLVPIQVMANLKFFKPFQSSPTFSTNK
jgi:hypothetical protein